MRGVLAHCTVQIGPTFLGCRHLLERGAGSAAGHIRAAVVHPPLTWHMPDRRQLQDHIVTGVGERFMPKEKKTSRVHRPGRDGDENPVLCEDPLAAGRAAAAARRGGASPSALSGLAAAAMHELGALDLGAEDDADRDVFAACADQQLARFGSDQVGEGYLSTPEIWPRFLQIWRIFSRFLEIWRILELREAKVDDSFSFWSFGEQNLTTVSAFGAKGP